MDFEKLLCIVVILLKTADGARTIDIPGENSLATLKKSRIAVVHASCETENNSTILSCIGTVIDALHVLTTSDCVKTLIQKNENICRIIVSSDDQHLSVDHISVHPKSTEFSVSSKYNVALLRLVKPIESDSLQSSSINRFSISPETFSENVIQQTDTFTIAVYVNEFDSIYMNDENIMMLRINNLKCQRSKQHVGGCYTIIKQRYLDSCKHLREKPVFVWTNDEWEQIGITSEFVEDVNGSCIGFYNPLTWSYSWINSLIRNHTTAESFDRKSDEATTYECDRWSYCGCSTVTNVTIDHRKNATEEATPYSWSMIVSIRIDASNLHACAGTVLTNYDVLTSASCVHQVKTEDISIVYGIHNIVDDWNFPRFASSVKIHPNWNSSARNDANDIAIISFFIPLPIVSAALLSRTCIPDLPETSNLAEYPPIDTRLIIVSWKSVTDNQTTSSNVLQQATTYVADNQDSICQQSVFDENKQICINTLSKNRCYGDSGSPVFQWRGSYWEQVGLVTNDEICKSNQSRTIFTRLAYYFDWIKSNVQVPLTTAVPTTTTRAPRPPPYVCDRKLNCGCSKNYVELTKSRIVGGEDANDDSWTMIVYLRDGTRPMFCSGSILSESFILTAAHCVRDYSYICPSNLWVVAGVTNRSDSRQISRKVNQIYIHPNYNASSSERRNDIAILRLGEPLVLDSERQITRTCIGALPSLTTVTDYPQAGTRLAIAGWGTLRYSSSFIPETLQQAEVFAIDNNDTMCRDLTYFQEGQMCAGLSEGGKDSCQGDSGGGIFMWTGAFWEQVGIVSFGRDCALPNIPGVYTRLPIYYLWIASILDLYNEHIEPKPESTKSFTHHLNQSSRHQKYLLDECEIISTTSATPISTVTATFTSSTIAISTSATLVTTATTENSGSETTTNDVNSLYTSSTSYASTGVNNVTTPSSGSHNFDSDSCNALIQKILFSHLVIMQLLFS